MRKPPGFGIMLCAGVLFCSGCDTEPAAGPPLAIPHRDGEPAAVSRPPQVRATGAVRIATFNVQVYGVSKARDPFVMDILARVMRQFDVVAMQEVRAKDQTVVSQLVDQINADGARYGYILGPRLGRTISKEQYAFIFDTERIEVDRDYIYTVGDPQDALHREPLVARFRVREIPVERAFAFTLINVHTDPDLVDTELNVLDDVYRVVLGDGSGEDDVILLGDLNADARRWGELGGLPGISGAVAETTNARRTKAYDNIVFDRRMTVEYTGVAGVLDLAAHFGLSQDEVLRVSDHLPVWAEFGVYEQQEPALATRPR